MSQSLERKHIEQSSEDITTQRQLRFLELIMKKSQTNPKLLGFLQVIAKEFGEVVQ